VNGDGSFTIGEVKAIIADMERVEAEEKNLKKLIIIVVLCSLLFCGGMMGMIIGGNEMSKETHTSKDGGSVMEDLKGNAIKTASVSSVGTLLDLPDYDAEVMKGLKDVSFTPIILTGNWDSDENATVYTVTANVTVFMKVIGFQKDARGITLHGGYNGQSLLIQGDYASYTVGGKQYDVDVEVEAGSRRRLDRHHARQGTARRWLFDDQEDMLQYYEVAHSEVDLTVTDLNRGRALVSQEAGHHRRRLSTLGGSSFNTRKTWKAKGKKATVSTANWAPFPKFFAVLGRIGGRSNPPKEPTERCTAVDTKKYHNSVAVYGGNRELGVRCCKGSTKTNPKWIKVKGKKNTVNWMSAQQACAEEEATLCTRMQIVERAQAGDGFLGDGNDNRMVWTSTPCGNTPAQKHFLTRFGWGRPKESTEDAPVSPDTANWAPFDYFFVYIGRNGGRSNALKASAGECLRADKTQVATARVGSNKATGVMCCETNNKHTPGWVRVDAEKGRNWAGAMQECADKGYTLCSRDQIKTNSDKGAGYLGEGLDNYMLWTSTPCNMELAQQKYMTRFGWGKNGNKNKNLK
jgi:hypothetical protein